MTITIKGNYLDGNFEYFLFKRNSSTCVGVTEVFFDGEEAFIDFDEVDGLYGSKHLANLWAGEHVSSSPNHKSEMDRIEVFVLLDLIGEAAPKFSSFSVRNGLYVAQIPKNLKNTCT